jgi:hypothetical protein
MDPTKKDLYTAKRPSGVDTSDPEVQNVIEKLRSDSDPVNWIILKLNGTAAIVHGYGPDGISEFSSNLNDEDIYYGAIRCVVDDLVKFYHVFFVGQQVGGMKRGKASLYKSAIFSLVDAQGEIACVTGCDDYSEQYLLDQIRTLSKGTTVNF